MTLKSTASKPNNASTNHFHSLFDTNRNIKVRALSVVALAGAVGNSLGFLANLILYGFNFVTAFCFLCAVLIICNLFFGLRSKHSVCLGYLMLILLDVLEFPLLTLTYGAVMYPYLIIGFHAVVLVTEKNRRILLSVLLGLYDLAIIVYSGLNPYIFGPQDSVGLLGSAVVTFAISVFTVASLVIMWQNVYRTETIEIDPVANVLSREGFISKAAKLIASEESGAYILLYFNVVSFKAINSIFGIAGGNRFLSSVAQYLSHAAFSPKLIGRTEADHFVCLVRKEDLRRDTLDSACQMPYMDKGRAINVLLNCGIYQVLNKDIPVTSMCDRARAALRFLHVSGSKFYAEYDAKVENSYHDETELIGEIDNAIHNKQFHPYYQPIVDCETLQVVSAEALARWIHPEKGVISPSVFIPVLEKKDMISTLDRIIAGHVHSAIEARLTDGKHMVPVSVNLSRMDFYDNSMMNELYATLKGTARGHKWHRFEITESVYEDMSSNTLFTISALRKYGASILVDDFGSGFSSLGMITDYEFDFIKLDVQFARKIVENERVRGVVQSLTDMAHKLGAKVIAEGVENEAQFSAVKACGCDYVQGYYFYKPMPEEQFLSLLDNP